MKNEKKSLIQVINSIVDENIDKNEYTEQELLSIKNYIAYKILNKNYFHHSYSNISLKIDPNDLTIVTMPDSEGTGFYVNDEYMPNSIVTEKDIDYKYREYLKTIISEKDKSLLNGLFELMENTNHLKDLAITKEYYNEIIPVLKKHCSPSFNRLIVLLEAVATKDPELVIKLRTSIPPFLRECQNVLEIQYEDDKNDHSNRHIKEHFRTSNFDFMRVCENDGFLSIEEKKIDVDSFLDRCATDILLKNTYMGILMRPMSHFDKYIELLNKSYFSELKETFGAYLENNLSDCSLDEYDSKYKDITSIVENRIESEFKLLVSGKFKRSGFTINKNDPYTENYMKRIQEEINLRLSNHIIKSNNLIKTNVDLKISNTDKLLFTKENQFYNGWNNTSISLYSNEFQCVGFIKTNQNKTNKIGVPVLELIKYSMSSSMNVLEDLDIRDKFLKDNNKKIIILFRKEQYESLGYSLDSLHETEKDIVILNICENNNVTLKSDLKNYIEVALKEYLIESDYSYDMMLEFVKKARAEITLDELYDISFVDDNGFTYFDESKNNKLKEYLYNKLDVIGSELTNKELIEELNSVKSSNVKEKKKSDKKNTFFGIKKN